MITAPRTAALLIAAAILSLSAPSARGAGIDPFATSNQSPLIQIYGLPAAGSAMILPAGRYAVAIAQDVASNYQHDDTATESIMLDGESCRTTLTLRRGFAHGLEAGIDIPLVGQSGGVFDSFIEGWHSFFSLPQGGRDTAPRDRLLYRYDRDGSSRLLMESGGYGPGDISLAGGWQLYREKSDAVDTGVALRGSLKLPTGSSSRLRGSGSTDLALWLTANRTATLANDRGRLGLFAAGGGMAMTDGDVLPDQQRHLAGFGTVGAGYGPARWITLKLQLDGTTPFYSGSDLRELANPTVEIRMGGDINISPDTTLSIAVSEDLAVYTAPDVTLHISLSHQF